MSHHAVDTGRDVDFLDGYDLAPLGYQELLNFCSDKSDRIELKIRNANVIDSFGEVPLGAKANWTLPINLPAPSKTFALVLGGWLPPNFATRDRVLLLDRNMVSEIRNRFRKGKARNGPSPDFLDDLVNHRLRVNPFLYALEGNKRRTPTFDEVVSQVFEAVVHIQSALPNATIIPSLENAIRGTMGFIEDGFLSLENKTRFLVRCVPILKEKGVRERPFTAWDRILQIADECHVQRKNLTVLCVLSALMCPQDKLRNPAWKILKPEKHYSAGSAYNALCDLRALEFLLVFSVSDPGFPVTFCTKETSLALFWAGLGGSNVRMDERRAVGAFQLDAPLFPGVTDEQVKTIY